LGGGVTPLSTSRGLPSYEEASRHGRSTRQSPTRETPGLSGAERSLSENDLAARFSAAMRMSRWTVMMPGYEGPSQPPSPYDYKDSFSAIHACTMIYHLLFSRHGQFFSPHKVILITPQLSLSSHLFSPSNHSSTSLHPTYSYTIHLGQPSFDLHQ